MQSPAAFVVDKVAAAAQKPAVLLAAKGGRIHTDLVPLPATAPNSPRNEEPLRLSIVGDLGNADSSVLPSDACTDATSDLI
jgi:hypothetical protein